MSTELERRLDRLAPIVDVEPARAAFGRRRQRDRRKRHVRVAAVAMAAAVVAGAGAFAFVADDGDRPVIAGPEPTTVTTNAVATPEKQVTTTAAANGIEIAITAPDRASAGSRLWFDVVVRNTSDATTYWQAGGCAIPVRVAAGPASSGGTVTTTFPEEFWDPNAGPLGTWLGAHNALSTTQLHQASDATGVRIRLCESISRLQAIEPGDEITHRGSVELRVPPGPVPDGGTYVLVATFQPYAEPGDFPDSPAAPIVVTAPLVIVDDAARGPDGAVDAIAAFESDPRLATWIESTALPERPDLVQGYATELSWWRGAWDLWLAPHWAESRALRMRYDPTLEEVVDVRIVSSYQAPDDEPDGVDPLSSQPDEILE